MKSLIGAMLAVSLPTLMMHFDVIHTSGKRVVERPQLSQSGALWAYPEILTDFFLNDYPHGTSLMPDSEAYKMTWVSSGSFGIPAYVSLNNNIKVAANPLVLCNETATRWATECVALFHYTGQVGFMNIMDPHSSFAFIRFVFTRPRTKVCAHARPHPHTH